MLLMLKDSPVLEISESGACGILDFNRLPWKSLFAHEQKKRLNIHTPELTALGVSAKGWVREEYGIFLW